MLLGEKIREIRGASSLSQGDLEARTGLKRCYISRVERGYTVPSVGTLEKIANGLQIPLYRFFWDESDPQPKTAKNAPPNEYPDWASVGTGAQKFRKLRVHLGKMDGRHRSLLLLAAKHLSLPTPLRTNRRSPAQT
jgi:transcriptional regulator with XRE-family HTH domain